MKEDFVTYELAVKLKEKGFDWDRITTYNPKTKVRNNHLEPTISQVLKWLRKEKKIYVAIDFFRFNGNTELWWTYSVKYIEDDSTENLYDNFKSWEQAAIAGIEYVIDNLI